jgi:hypothetical protein
MRHFTEPIEIELAHKTVEVVVLKIAWQNLLGEVRIVMDDHILSTLGPGYKPLVVLVFQYFPDLGDEGCDSLWCSRGIDRN